MVAPEGASIKIEQIRELQKEFAYRATASGTKIYVLYHAEKMTVQAANSLLKFLEEPNSRCGGDSDHGEWECAAADDSIAGTVDPIYTNGA